MVIVILSYKRPVEEIERFLPEHILFLDKYYACKKFVFSGRRIPRVGGVILVNVSTAEEALTIIQEDPFKQNELADYEIIEFTPTKWDQRFNEFINS